MGDFKIIHIIGICLVLCNVCSCQKFNFTDSIKINQHHDESNSQGNNWSVEGGVQLSNADLVIFDSKISIQTCHQVCTVDLTSCSGEKHTSSSDSCFCSLKSGKDHRLHISSKFKTAQSGAKLTAVIPSRDIFGPITGTYVIGTLPVVSNSNVKATYQVDNGQIKNLLPDQTITVCSDSYVSIKVCVERKPRQGRLKIQLNEQTTLSDGRCVKVVEKYNFYEVSTHKLTFSLEDADSFVYPELFTIQIIENKQSCSLTTTTPTMTSTEETKKSDTSSVSSKGKDVEYHDVFNYNSRDWRLVFRGTPYIEKSVWDSYVHTQVISVEPGCREVYSNAPCTNHYRNNDALENWSNINQVAFVVFKDNKTVAHVVFDAVGSDFKNWFSKSRVIDSSWVDMKSSSAFAFSIDGYNAGKFVMLHEIIRPLGCAGDSGWFFALDKHRKSPCPVESRGSSKIPKFIYAKNNVLQKYTKGEMDTADYIAVFLKYF